MREEKRVGRGYGKEIEKNIDKAKRKRKLIFHENEKPVSAF